MGKWCVITPIAVRKLEQHVRRILLEILLDLWPNGIGGTLRDLAAHVISL